jgi:hypothetical protein
VTHASRRDWNWGPERTVLIEFEIENILPWIVINHGGHPTKNMLEAWSSFYFFFSVLNLKLGI